MILESLLIRHCLLLYLELEFVTTHVVHLRGPTVPMWDLVYIRSAVNNNVFPHDNEGTAIACSLTSVNNCVFGFESVLGVFKSNRA